MRKETRNPASSRISKLSGITPDASSHLCLPRSLWCRSKRLPIRRQRKGPAREKASSSRVASILPRLCYFAGELFCSFPRFFFAFSFPSVECIAFALRRFATGISHIFPKFSISSLNLKFQSFRSFQRRRLARSARARPSELDVPKREGTPPR